jgi:hypothetical protein
MPLGLMKGWMLTFMLAFWRMSSSNISNILRKGARILSFSKIMTLSTLAKRPKPSFKIIEFMLWTGQLSLQTSIPLSIFGNSSSSCLPSMKIPYKG